MIHVGKCIDVMRGMAADSVDAIVTDPPYGLSFMNQRWDYDVPSTDVWAECLRVLKPGGHLLAFASTRTQHRMAVRIEDAGFEIRDMIAWIYGSGFPKSHNGPWGGTALKPALEPITVARKPLQGTVEANWREHGTGALNTDDCGVGAKFSDGGRWPANLIHDGSDEVLAAFPAAKGQQGPISQTAPSEKTGGVYGRMRREGELSAKSANRGGVGFKMRPGQRQVGDGSAARFFYCAKASPHDRNSGLDNFEAGMTGDGRTVNADGPHLRGTTLRRNIHPTVKPTDLMRYLCRLVTPRGGLVLDPFAGSGSTGRAAVMEGFQFVGIERDPEYAAIAEARIRVVQPGLSLEATA